MGIVALDFEKLRIPAFYAYQVLFLLPLLIASERNGTGANDCIST